jgi:ribosome biogenesis GTP-binding protein YsxC/EngB
MHKKIGLKRIIIIILIPTLLLLPLFTILTLFSYTAFANEDITTYSRFSDVPENHWAFKAIHHLRSLKITNGIGNNQFGLGLTIKRSEFVAFLAKLMKWELISPEKGSFADNMDTTKWYYAFVETALKYGTILKDAEDFRPDEPTTREEMAIMIVRTLGYDTLANQLTYLDNPFDDVYKNTEYITIARDFGIIKGVGNNSFKPFATAKREEAAAMMMRMYEKLNYPINELHAFYAIRSAHQVEMFSSLDSVGFGWSRLEYDYDTNEVILNTTRKYDNEYAIPDGFSSPLNWAKENNVSTQLMVYANNDELVNIETEASIPLLEYVLTNSEIRKQVISSIVQHVNNTRYELTAVKPDQYPQNNIPEIIFVGRSNVGKSTVINTLLNRKNLARVGSTPGKTREINFYNIDDKAYFVDLPGYGYANVSKSKKSAWGSMIETYLHSRKYLELIMMLVDIRHTPTDNDIIMYEWIQSHNMPNLIIATKADKISRGRINSRINDIRITLKCTAGIPVIAFSSITKQGRDEIWEQINNRLAKLNSR